MSMDGLSLDTMEATCERSAPGARGFAAPTQHLRRLGAGARSSASDHRCELFGGSREETLP